MRWLVLVIVILLPRTAAAQARVSFKGWMKDGTAVLDVADPLLAYRTQTWAKDGGERFTAACVAAPLASASETCRVCTEPGDCAVVASVAPKRLPSIKKRRSCSGPARKPDACKLELTIGDRGTFVHALWAPRYQATFDVRWRADGDAVFVVLHDLNEIGDTFDTFAVLHVPAKP